MYGWIVTGIAAAVIIGGGATWFKSTMNDNARLKAKNATIQTMLDQAEENTKFERTRAQVAEATSAKVAKEKDKVANDFLKWRQAYEAKINGGDAQATEWAKLPVPPAVLDSLRQRDAGREAYRVRPGSVAADSRPGMPVPSSPTKGGDANRPVPN